MSYDPGTPLPQDIPADSQDEFLTNFDTLNQFYGVDHIPFGNKIVSATLANPCVITSPGHRLSTGNNITVFALRGINEAGVFIDWTINGNSYNVTVIGDNNFSIPADTSAEPAYDPESGNFLVNTANYGYGSHRKITFSQNTAQGPEKASPFSSIYMKKFITKKFTSNLDNILKDFEIFAPFFKNNLNQEVQLAEYNLTGTQQSILGFKSSFGPTINFGRTHFVSGTSLIVPLSIPYLTTHFTTIVTLFKTSGLSSTSELIVTTLTNDNFTVTRSGSQSTGREFFYISMGI
jgi:hypothetical protein